MTKRLQTFGRNALLGLLIAALLSGLLGGLLGGPLKAPAAAQSEQPTPPSAELPALSSDFFEINRLLPVPLTATTEMPDLAPIYLDGRQLFFLSAPALDDERATGQPPTEVRAQEIQTRLNEIARQLPRDRSTPLPEVSVEVDEPSTLPVIFVGPQPLLTVTTLDAQFSGYATPNDLADVFRGRLVRAFERYVEERSPTAFRRQCEIAFTLLGAAAIAQIFIRQLQKRIQRRQSRLMSDRSEIKRKSRARTDAFPAIKVAADDVFETVFEQIKARLDNRQKRKLNEAFRNLLWIAQIVLWLTSLFLVLNLFPQSRWLATLLLAWIKIPARILAIAGITYIAVRLSSVLIEKSVFALQEGAQWAPEQSQRLSLRFSTFSQVAKGVAGSMLSGVGIMFMLATAGIEIGPLLAGAGIAGVAVSLAAQSLIKDIINGFLILFEDQFGVGDVISTGEVSGMVESLNLRITQLRDSEGRLITIPNSQISTVQNLSMDWAQVDLSVTIAHQNNLADVLTLLKEIATELSQAADWQRFILEPPEVLGVENLDYKGITLRLWLKTQPLKQWAVARELRQRIKYAFDQKGIEIGIPQEEITVLQSSAASTHLSMQPSIEPPMHSDE
ncbi:MAG: mechanosensitive ion channel family protein [Phormidesmis sp.]